MEQQIASPLVDHLSYSSVTQLARNPLMFKKTYILKIYSNVYSPSAVVGTAAHKFCEHLLKGESVSRATELGLDYINRLSDVAIEYGKTGSREKIIADYTKAVQFYMQESPEWSKRDIISVESSLTKVIHDLDGNALSIPAKAKSDVIWRSTRKETFAGHEFPKGSLFIEDHKFSRGAGADDTEDDGARIIQAMFNYHVVKEELGEEPVALLFRETKISQNKDGSPQCNYYVIKFDQRHDFETFYNLYNDVTRFLSQPEPIFLPNFQDMFDGKEALTVYRQNLITADAPVVVKKTHDVRYAEPNFVPATVDKVENINLTPEEKIKQKLLEFGIASETHETFTNGSVVMYTLKVSRGVKMTKIGALEKDLAIALKAQTIRIQAPIMGTDLVGIEVPHERRDVIPFLIEGQPDDKLVSRGTLNIPIGMDVYGNTVAYDLRDMPHLLVAGSTGSGKSVFLNVALRAISAQMDASELNLVLIDPKRVELSQFKDLPHLAGQIIFDHDKAVKALSWLVSEMNDRYEVLEAENYRNIKEYNEDHVEKMKYIVCVIDEFAELMLTKTKGETSFAELAIVRLSQKARAVGIHLILATQRPSVDVVTGLIKANLPTRVAFMTTSRTDSQVILDQNGAEELTGRGDMLFLHPQTRGLQRLQGFFA